MYLKYPFKYIYLFYPFTLGKQFFFFLWAIIETYLSTSYVKNCCGVNITV